MSMISHYVAWNGLGDVGNHQISIRECVTWKLQANFNESEALTWLTRLISLMLGANKTGLFSIWH